MASRAGWRREAWVLRAAGSAAAMLSAASAPAAARPVTAISGHAYLDGAAEHAGIAVTLSQVYVGFSGPALGAMLIALAAVLLLAWRRGVGPGMRLAVAAALGLAIVAGGGCELRGVNALVEPLEAVTDAAGSFSFSPSGGEVAFAAGRYNVRYRRDAYAEARRILEVGADDGPALVLDAVTL
ncbi:MAG: hypothetical protein HYV63_23205, partial [Candidatus Schekmanbacteria bacterium]|nr:hypothetical protein [Candidatus Schekmanbacteria bacterium]